MRFLGQALQRSPRRREVRFQFLGIVPITSSGPFSWTVPTPTEYVDIVAVGGSASCNSVSLPSYSGSVCQRIAKPVYPGFVISGTVGAAGGDVGSGQPGGDTMVDGMVAKGAGLAAPGTPSGGDVNILGNAKEWSGNHFYDPGGSVSLLDLGRIGPRLVDPMLTGFGGSYVGHGSTVPGAGTGSGNGGGSFTNGMAGGVIFIMYRSL